MVYKWRHMTYPVAPETAHQVISSLNEVTPAAIVDAARPKTSPLHPCFEWKDNIAAEEYRKQQARMLVNSLQIVREDKPPVRAFVHISVEDDKPKEYVEINTAMNNAMYRRQVLIDALRELESFRRKYAELREFSKLFEEVDNVSLFVHREIENRATM